MSNQAPAAGGQGHIVRFGSVEAVRNMIAGLAPNARKDCVIDYHKRNEGTSRDALDDPEDGDVIGAIRLIPLHEKQVGYLLEHHDGGVYLLKSKRGSGKNQTLRYLAYRSDGTFTYQPHFWGIKPNSVVNVVKNGAGAGAKPKSGAPKQQRLKLNPPKKRKREQQAGTEESPEAAEVAAAAAETVAADAVHEEAIAIGAALAASIEVPAQQSMEEPAQKKSKTAEAPAAVANPAPRRRGRPRKDASKTTTTAAATAAPPASPLAPTTPAPDSQAAEPPSKRATRAAPRKKPLDAKEPDDTKKSVASKRPTATKRPATAKEPAAATKKPAAKKKQKVVRKFPSRPYTPFTSILPAAAAPSVAPSTAPNAQTIVGRASLRSRGPAPEAGGTGGRKHVEGDSKCYWERLTDDREHIPRPMVFRRDDRVVLDGGAPQEYRLTGMKLREGKEPGGQLRSGRSGKKKQQEVIERKYWGPTTEGNTGGRSEVVKAQKQTKGKKTTPREERKMMWRGELMRSMEEKALGEKAGKEGAQDGAEAKKGMATSSLRLRIRYSGGEGLVVSDDEVEEVPNPLRYRGRGAATKRFTRTPESGEYGEEDTSEAD
ncbi:MAG: hypothetical protein LQ340_000106 [Diploschistes diacapsis]|nr:MAG: hypothetical protein LQ340_000106 [Diploschistes diacapsis]